MNLEEMLLEVREQISRDRWTVVAMDQIEDIPSLIYTVGLKEMGFPDLIIVGVAVDPGRLVLSEVTKYVVDRGEALEHGDLVQDIADLPLAVIDVLSEKLRVNSTFMAKMHYESPEYGLQQLVVPDSLGNFPWDANCDSELMDGQPLLGSPLKLN